ATDVLELNGGMADREAFGQHAVDAAQNGIAGRGRHVLDQDVAAQGVRAGTETPDVEVVNVEHAVDLPGGVGDVGEFHPARQALQQDVEGLADDIGGGVDDQKRDRDGEDRVDLLPAGGADHERADDDGDGAERVAEHVDEGAAHVEVVAARRAQGEHDGGVEDQTQPRYHDHDAFVYRLGRAQPEHRLIKDPDGEGAKRQGVDESGEHAG